MTYTLLQHLLEFQARTVPRAIMMAGAPGSGKSTVVRQIIAGTNAKWVDVDQITQLLAKKTGMDIKTQGDDLHPIARQKMVTRRKHFIESKYDLIIDGTGRDAAGVRRLKEELEANGYEVAMVFVAVDLTTSLTRNASRSKEVDGKMAEEAWHAVMKNLRELHSMFDTFFYVKNDDQPSEAAVQAANKFLRA